MSTVHDVELNLARKISETLRELGVLPKGYRCAVRLHGMKRDKKGSADFQNSWHPDSDSIRIEFERIPEEASGSEDYDCAADAAGPAAAEDPLFDLIRALAQAESRPGYDFVSLKWFRDTALPSEGYSWTADETARHHVLRDAIDRRLVLTHKVPNPKSPYPVTAIRLNRLMPEVKKALSAPDANFPDFRPVTIRGEALSMTVQRDRR